MFQMLYIVFGIFASYSLVSLLSEKIIGRMIAMSSAVFFVYALHNTCVLAFCGGVMNRLPLSHAIVIVIVPFVTFLVCYGIYWGVKRICPQVLALLCGGRA